MTTRSSSLGIKDVELLGGDQAIGDEEVFLFFLKRIFVKNMLGMFFGIKV